MLLDNIYETLLTSDDGGNVGPGLATLDVSDDGLTYTLTLQDGVTFSDGKPLTSADVKWSLDQARYPGAPASDGSAPAASDATTPSAPGNAAGNLASIATVDAPDDSTVVLTLAQPDNLLAFQLSQRGGAVLEEGATDLENSATGTGPFTLERVEPGLVDHPRPQRQLLGHARRRRRGDVPVLHRPQRRGQRAAGRRRRPAHRRAAGA